MKKTILTIALLFAFALTGHSQTRTFNLPLSFKVNETSLIVLGNEFDGQFKDMNGSINMKFDGKTFLITFSDGAVYSKTKVISYQRKVNKKYDKIETIAYILKIAKDGFIQYIIIKKEFDKSAFVTTVEIPYLSELGETNGYNYYRKFVIF